MASSINQLHPLRQCLSKIIESNDFNDNICVLYDDTETTSFLTYEQCKVDIVKIREDLKNIESDLCLIGLKFSDNAPDIIKIVPTILAITLHPNCSFVVLSGDKPELYSCTHIIGQISS